MLNAFRIPKTHPLFLLFLGCILQWAPISAFALTLSTWNMEWLSDKGDKIQGRRNQDDYFLMQTIVSVLNPDILAFQEVDSLSSLSKVIDKNQYHFFLSERSKTFKHPQSSQQFTGWAVKKNIEVIDHPDLRALGLSTFTSGGHLRYGAYIEIKPPNSPPLHLLSIHLKSGCFDDVKKRKKSCKKLKRQMDSLSVWITTRLAQNQEFVIAGDFNHYLNEDNEWFFKMLKKDISNAPLLHLSKNTKAHCEANRYQYRTKKWKPITYKKLIDHIIVSPGVIHQGEIPQAKQYQYSKQNVMTYRLSDHCPVYVKLPPHKAKPRD